MELQVSELEKDIIKEILNIGLARAADSFAVIAKDIVLLKVPDLLLTDPKDVINQVVKYEATHVIAFQRRPDRAFKPGLPAHGI